MELTTPPQSPVGWFRRYTTAAFEEASPGLLRVEPSSGQRFEDDNPGLRSAEPTSVVEFELGVDDLYRRHRAAVHAKCRRILGSCEAAEDAVQETFMRLQRHRPHVSDADEALRWLYRVAINHCLNQVRNRQLRTARHKDPILSIAAQDLSDLLDSRSTARWLLGSLPQNLRVIAWLHYVHGLGQQEVADLLGLSRRTVVNRVAEFHARAQQLMTE